MYEAPPTQKFLCVGGAVLIENLFPLFSSDHNFKDNIKVTVRDYSSLFVKSYQSASPCPIIIYVK
jgi:hypothetical protein